MFFFANVASLASYYESGIVSVPLYIAITAIILTILSFIAISDSIKLSVINLKKINTNIIDTIPEGKKHYKVLPSYFNLLFTLIIAGYFVIGLYCYTRLAGNTISTLNIQDIAVQETLFFLGLVIINVYYFIQIFRINTLVKKYGIVKNKH